MAQDNYNEQELQRTESELRSLGEPYDSMSPGDAYFAGLPSKVMNRIHAKENRLNEEGFLTKLKSTFFGSKLRTSILGVCAVTAIVAVLLINSDTDAPVAVTYPVPQTTAPQTQRTEKPITQEAPAQKPMQHQTKQNAVESAAPSNTSTNRGSDQNPMQERTPPPVDMQQANALDETGDFSNYDETLSTGSEDDPVTFDKLSTSELEAVLKILEEN